MTQRHKNSFGALVCTGDDSRRYSTVRLPIPNEQDKLVYHHPSNAGEQYALPSLDISAPVVQPFTCGPEFCHTAYSSEITPSIESSQYAYYQADECLHAYPEMYHQSRPSLQLNPFTSNMEPYFVYPPGALPAQMQTSIPQSAYSSAAAPDVMSMRTTSGVGPDMMPFRTTTNEYYPTQAWQQSLPVFFSPEYDQGTSNDEGMDVTDSFEDLDDDENNNYDKPYAQLIYEALLQAPGHRMLLRDIYDWFVTNTRKPRESGTNGWQNSIRHNLSMNQVCLHSFVL